MSKGGVFIISGPSGSGKDTLLKELFKRFPKIRFSISSVTRSMRDGEVEGEKYNFISREKFESMIADDQLLEYNIYLDNYYGTPKSQVEVAVANGEDIVIEVDVNGAANIRKKLPKVHSIFIMPPSFSELKRRLEGRGTEAPQVIEMRLGAALSEIARATEYDFIVVNDNIDTAVDNIVSIISSCSLELERQKHIIDEVLQKC